MAAEGAELEHVRAALRSHYGIQVSDIKLLDAGSTPNHWVTATSGEQFLAKALRTRQGAWVEENAHQVTTLAAHIASHGLPTPAPVRTVDGSLVAILSGPAEKETTHLVVLPWAVGYTRADHMISSSPMLASPLLDQLGAILAKLHSLPPPDSLSLPKPEAPGGHNLCDIGTFLECAGNPASLFQGQDTEDAKWFRSWLPKLVELWKDVPEPMALCHGDAYLDNVLASQSEKGGGISLMLVDWEDSCMSNPIVDLAACAVGTCFTLSLGEGSEDVAVTLVQERIIALVAGYQTQRTIPACERALLRPMMQACAWACGVFRYGRFLEGVTDLKTRKYGQLIEVVNILSDMGGNFEATFFP